MQWQLLVLAWCAFLHLGQCMFHKNKRATTEHVPAAKRLRANLADLYLSNQLAGERIQNLASDAHDSGANNMDLRTAGSYGRLRKNITRDLKRKLMRGNKWQPNYYAKIRIWDKQSQSVQKKWVAVALPHEILHSLVFFNEESVFLNTTGMCHRTKQNFLGLKAELGGELCGLGLWGDGIPVNWDRSESIDTWSLNIPGLPGPQGSARFPLAALNHKHVAKKVTNDDLLEIFAWSFRCLLEGKMPSSRHDKSRWLSHDKWRQKLQNKCIGGGSAGFRAALTEVRGDWKHYADVFRLPAHNTKASCCWLCSCTPKNIRDVFANATWRIQRTTHWDNVTKWLNKGSISPILSFPGFRTAMFLIDWLHVMDLGVANEFQANIFLLLLTKMPGSTVDARCSALFKILQTWYSQHPCDSRLDNLVPTMLSGKKGVKLRARGAETRNLIPFTLEMALLHLDSSVPLEAAAKQAAVHLHAMYQNLSEHAFCAEHLKLHSRLFALQLVALEKFTLATDPASKAWKVKPKLHLMQELAEESVSNPSAVWCYRDEDYGGTIARLARSRGGPSPALACSRKVLQTFYANHDVPHFV